MGKDKPRHNQTDTKPDCVKCKHVVRRELEGHGGFNRIIIVCDIFGGDLLRARKYKCLGNSFEGRGSW